MCGRYTLFTDREIREMDEIIEQISKDYPTEKMATGDIYPTNVVPVLVEETGVAVPRLMTWGMPGYQNKGVIINARSETAREKRMFQHAMEKRRCIIPSTGFYEWDRNKRKYLFTLESQQMVYMAGIFNVYEEESRFAILTTAPNASVAPVHDRMPVLVPSNQIQAWLSGSGLNEQELYHHQPELINIFMD